MDEKEGGQPGRRKKSGPKECHGNVVGTGKKKGQKGALQNKTYPTLPTRSKKTVASKFDIISAGGY